MYDDDMYDNDINLEVWKASQVLVHNESES